MHTEIKKRFSKKMIGSAVFALLIGAMTLSTSASVKALFVDTSKILNMDAAVVSVGSSSLVVDTAGTPNITVDVNGKTVFTGGASMGVIAPGDTVHITAKTTEGGDVLALVIRKTGIGYGYGLGGKDVVVTDAEVIGKTADTFTVKTDSTTVTFKVLASTIFNNGNFLTLKIGDKVLVDGEQTSTEFIANSVVVKSNNKNDDKGNKDDKGKNDDKENKGNNEDKGQTEIKDTHANNGGQNDNTNNNGHSNNGKQK